MEDVQDVPTVWDNAKVLQAGFYNGTRDLTDTDLVLSAIDKAYWDLKAIEKYGEKTVLAEDVYSAVESYRSYLHNRLDRNPGGHWVNAGGRWYKSYGLNLEVHLGNPDTHEDYGLEEDFRLKALYKKLKNENATDNTK